MAQSPAPRKAANTALPGARPALTFRWQVALDEKQRLERAARIRQLREESPYTQEAVAERVGVKLRSYQKWEEGGGIEWEHLEALADLHRVDVQWIHRGRERGPAPELFKNPQLDRIEERLKRIEAALAADSALQESDPAPHSSGKARDPEEAAGT